MQTVWSQGLRAGGFPCCFKIVAGIGLRKDDFSTSRFINSFCTSHSDAARNVNALGLSADIFLLCC